MLSSRSSDSKPIWSSSHCPLVHSSCPFVYRRSLTSWKEADVRRLLGGGGGGVMVMGSPLCECLQRMSVKVSWRLRFPGRDREQDCVQGQGQGDSLPGSSRQGAPELLQGCPAGSPPASVPDSSPEAASCPHHTLSIVPIFKLFSSAPFSSDRLGIAVIFALSITHYSLSAVKTLITTWSLPPPKPREPF